MFVRVCVWFFFVSANVMQMPYFVVEDGVFCKLLGNSLILGWIRETYILHVMHLPYLVVEGDVRTEMRDNSLILLHFFNFLKWEASWPGVNFLLA